MRVSMKQMMACKFYKSLFLSTLKFSNTPQEKNSWQKISVIDPGGEFNPGANSVLNPYEAIKMVKASGVVKSDDQVCHTRSILLNVMDKNRDRLLKG